MGTFIWPFQLEPKVSRKCVGRTLKGWEGVTTSHRPVSRPLHHLGVSPGPGFQFMVSVASGLLLEAKSHSRPPF